MPGGRPTKLTEDTKNRLLIAIEAGAYLEEACQYAGIRYQTFRNWMTRGARETKGEFFEFFEEAKRAIAESEVSLLVTINQASARDWRAAAWLLSARFPSRWSADARTQTAIREAIALFLKDVEWFMQPKIYQQLLQAAEQVRGANLVPSKMTELEAIKVLLDARWLPADLVKRIGEAYGNFQEAVINTFVEGLAEQKK